jgi:hypothetical protein
MANRGAEISPLAYARTAGTLVLIILACASVGMMYVPSALFVPGDAVATATNIKASEWLYRLGMLSDAVLFLAEIVLVVVLYRLFEPVSRTLSLVAAYARLTMTVIQGVNLLNSFAVLLVLSGAGYLSVFDLAQLDALAMLFVEAHGQVVFIWEAVFALHCFVLGYLIYTSSFVPRALGILMVLAALAYLTESIGNILLPQYADTYAAIIGVAAWMGEIPFFLWLLFKGVDEQQWHERAATAGQNDG